MSVTITRYHDFSAGHRLPKGGKSSRMHGHNYRVHWTVRAGHLNEDGMIVDFSSAMKIPAIWLEEHWDHKMLLWQDDPFRAYYDKLPKEVFAPVYLPCKPTTEELAALLLEIFQELLNNHGVTVVSVHVEETRKCSATYSYRG